MIVSPNRKRYGIFGEWIDHMVVAPSPRGRGIGSNLATEAVTACTQGDARLSGRVNVIYQISHPQPSQTDRRSPGNLLIRSHASPGVPHVLAGVICKQGVVGSSPIVSTAVMSQDICKA